MAGQYINVGKIVNDGTGDDLHTAFTKINNNFYDLYLQGGQANTISNVGVGLGLYKEKIGVDLKLKTLIAGTNISLVSGTNDITISATVPNSIVTINADTGTLTANTNTQAINIVGGSGVHTSITGNTLTITGNAYTLSTDLHPTLSGNLNLNGHNIVGGAGTNISAETFTGNLTGNLTGNVTGLVYGLDIRQVETEATAFDFGYINEEVFTPIQLYLMSLDLDMGTVNSPSSTSINAGTIV